MIMNAWNITYSKKSDFIPLIGHGDPVPYISRSMEFTKDLWTSQSKNQDTLGQNMYESKKSDEKRTILRSSAPKYMKIYEIHKFDLWDSQKFQSWSKPSMSPTTVYHLCTVLPVVFEISQLEVSTKIHDLKRVHFWGGTMRVWDPRWRGKTYRMKTNFAPNESSNRALYVGMRISIRGCLSKKFQAFEHFSATKYVWNPIDLILDSELPTVLQLTWKCLRPLEFVWERWRDLESKFTSFTV